MMTYLVLGASGSTSSVHFVRYEQGNAATAVVSTVQCWLCMGRARVASSMSL